MHICVHPESICSRGIRRKGVHALMHQVASATIMSEFRGSSGDQDDYPHQLDYDSAKVCTGNSIQQGS